MLPKPSRVILLALASRLVVLACMLLSDWTFEDLDSSATLPIKPCAIAGAPESNIDGVSGLAVWDTVYFGRVARCGYEADKLNAFFPLVPAAMHAIGAATGLTGTQGHVMVALALNIAAFCAAAAYLHRCGARMLAPDIGSGKDGCKGKTRTADLALLLFCCNPASVFYSAAYTEAMFAACTWAGLLLLPAHHWAGVAALTAAAATRSNGILGVWFPLHKLLMSWRRQGGLRPRQVLQAALSSIAILAPYAAMQAHACLTHCVAGAGAQESMPVWCEAQLPSVYGYIQREYWDVGLLRFYRDPGRLPMVLMSVPVAWLSVGGCWAYFAADWRRALTLGLYCEADTLPPGLAAAERTLLGPWVLWLGWQQRLLGGGAGACKKRRQQRPAASAGAAQRPSALLSSQEAAPLVYHWALMTAVALLAMHVNVATRFLSACPPLYWHAAEWATRGAWHARLLWLWCFAYIVLGCLLFPNFYPWA